MVKMSHHFEDSHARRAEHDHYASGIAEFDGDHPRFGKYDQGALDKALPEVKHTLMDSELKAGS